MSSVAPGAAGASITARSVSRVFAGGVVAFEDLDLDVRSGEFVAILGPSGCGKSTLLRLVAGLDRPQRGALRVSGTGSEGASDRDRTLLAYVFQDAHLLPWRSVRRNVELPLELAGVPRAERAAAAARLIEQVGLTDAAGRYPAQLSGGMRMRASLARALVTEPELLLLDEPFAAVDEITRAYLDAQLLALWRERRMTVLFVTHSTSEAAFLAQRIVVLSARPARVVADVPGLGDPLRTPEARATPEFGRLLGALHAALVEGGA